MIRWEPIFDLANNRRILEPWSRFAAPGESGGSREDYFYPPVDIYTEGENVLIEMELPGVDVSKVDISINADELKISGEVVRAVELDSKSRFIRRERQFGKFQRLFSIDPKIRRDEIKANMKHGVLTISIPVRNKEEEETKRIAINQD